MNAVDTEKFSQRLLQLRADLLNIAETSKESARPVVLDQTSVGRLSRMDAMQSQQMAQETIRRRESRLVKIEGALKRIEDGDFGYCYVCGEEIDPRRLFAEPTTTRCVSCIDG